MIQLVETVWPQGLLRNYAQARDNRVLSERLTNCGDGAQIKLFQDERRFVFVDINGSGGAGGLRKGGVLAGSDV